MKNLFLLLSMFLTLAFTSCSQDDDNNPSLSSSLHSLNVSDAKSIFQKSGSDTKSGENEGGYWKINKDGEEVKLVLSDTAGNETDAEVLQLQKLSDDFLVMQVSGNRHVDGGIFFVNTESERIFQLPGGYNDPMWNAVRGVLEFPDPNFKTFQDRHGMIYFNISKQVIKLDTRDFTLSFELPDNQDFTDYHVTQDGFIWYTYGRTKVKCPGGNIQLIGGESFILNDKIYALEDKSIYHWEVIDNNTFNVLEKTFVCEFYRKAENEWEEDITYSISNIIENHVRERALLHIYGYGFQWFEFDGVNTPIFIADIADTPLDKFQYFGNGHSGATTKGAIYLCGDNKIFKLDLANYEVSEIDASHYEMHSMVSSKESDDFSFTGISFYNGKNIIGTVTGTGEVTTKFTEEEGNKIVNLIEIF